MKGLTRNFSRKEKVLIVLMVIVLLILAYSQFVDKPIKQSIEDERSQQNSIRTEIEAVNSQILEMEQMQQEIAELESIGKIILMPPYNASQKETNFISNVLQTTKGFNIAIADCTRNGDQIRRQFTVTFTTDTYKEMEWFLTKVSECPYRCLISEARCSVGRQRTPEGEEVSNVVTTLTFTFFETMVGGTPDAALPSERPGA